MLCAGLLLLLGAGYAHGGPPLSQILSLGDPQRAALPQRTKDRAIQRYGLRAMALRQDFVARHVPTYKVEIPDEKQPHRIRDQKGSGRCWIYATDRVLRSKLAARGCAAPELSTTFINYHTLRQVSRGLLVELAHGKAVDLDRVVEEASEGGYQAWAIDIIRRKGIVPKQTRDTTADGANSGLAITQLQTLLASAVRDCKRVKDGPQATRRRRKIAVDYGKQVDQLLNTTIGSPPKQFTIDGKRYTPKTYCEKALGLGAKDLDYVTLTHDPNRAWYRGYTHAECTGMPATVAYNVPADVLERAMKKTIRKGEAVYFAVNYDEDENPHWVSGEHVPKSATGVLSVAAFDYAPYIPQGLINKRDRVSAGINGSNHAMAITGYDPGKRGGSVVKWKVENSHGKSSDDKGHLHMYDDFFRHYADEVVVPRSALPKGLLKRLTARPPLGTE